MKIQFCKWAFCSLFVLALFKATLSQEIEDDKSGLVETKANPLSNRFRADAHVNETDDQDRLISLTVRLTKVAEGQGTGDGLIDNLPGGVQSIGGIKGVDVIAYVLGPQLGGRGSRDNLFPQNRKVNRGQWKANEDKIVKLVDETGSALLIYFLEYEKNSPSSRPTKIAVSVLRDLKDDVTFVVGNPPTLT